MIQYAVAWHPVTDNLGDDLLTLAASRHLPRLDRVLNADALDAPLPDLEPDDRIVALMAGSILRHPMHWPPERHIAPAMAGVHFSREDVWGVPFTNLGQTGLKYLTACSPIGCRDERTAALLQAEGIPHQLTACLTLTLQRPAVALPARPYMVLCDVPEDIAAALQQHPVGLEVRTTTHAMANCDPDFHHRMAAAQSLLETYAAAQCVITRRLHCAMACLAIGTPVLLLYHASYEDVSRFAPMDSMLRTASVEDFLRQVREERFLPRWHNPDAVADWQTRLTDEVQASIAHAETMPLPILAPEEAAAWRQTRVSHMARSAAHKIRRLEAERYEQLHEKFTLLLREDAAKSTLLPLLESPEIRRTLRRMARRRQFSACPWYARPALWWKLRQGAASEDDLYRAAVDALLPLGWPDHDP